MKESHDANQELTRLLEEAAGGDADAAGRLADAVHAELRRVARSYLGRERGGPTLQATALVHEAWLRLFPGGDASFENRRHFFGSAAQAMRRILVDRARRRERAGLDRGSERADDPGITAVVDDVAVPVEDLLSVHEAFDELAALYPRKAEVVELRYFCGLTEPEVAAVLGASRNTVTRDWQFARSWLHRRLSDRRSEES